MALNRKIKIVENKKLQEKEISAKDLTKKEFYSYLFGDFVRASYIVGSFFFDLLLVPQAIFYIDQVSGVNQVLVIARPINLDLAIEIDFWVNLALAVLLLVLLEMIFYRRRLSKKFGIENIHTVDEDQKRSV